MIYEQRATLISCRSGSHASPLRRFRGVWKLHFFPKGIRTHSEGFLLTPAMFLSSRLAAFADRPAGTSALYVQEMSSGGEKQPPSAPRPPQVLDAHAATPHTPSGTFSQLALLLYFWLSSSHLSSSPSWLNSVCSPACFPVSRPPLFRPGTHTRTSAWGLKVKGSATRLKNNNNGGKGVPRRSILPSPLLTIKPCFSS